MKLTLKEVYSYWEPSNDLNPVLETEETLYVYMSGKSVVTGQPRLVISGTDGMDQVKYGWIKLYSFTVNFQSTAELLGTWDNHSAELLLKQTEAQLKEAEAAYLKAKQAAINVDL